MNLKVYWDKKKRIIDSALSKYLPLKNGRQKVIYQAMRYSVFPGGKRIRPLLALAAYESVSVRGLPAGRQGKNILPLACALELIHSYSLVHDDLPAMDNDDYRRGKLTCHKKFGEDVAILCGDALLTLSFELLAKSNIKNKAQIIQEIAQSIGTEGMLGGQLADIQSGNFKKRKVGLKNLDYINKTKTASLITACLKTGALAALADNKKLKLLEKFSRDIGLVFQIVDDILDNDGYARALGKKKAEEKARALTLKAKRNLKSFGRRAELLNKIADFILERKY